MVIIIEKTNMKAKSLQFEAKAYSGDECIMSVYGVTPASAENKLRTFLDVLHDEISELLYPKASDIALITKLEDIIADGADFDYNDDEILVSRELVEEIIKAVRIQFKKMIVKE